MCVHVVCAEDGLPGGELVWAREQSEHAVVYVDRSLVTDSGKLTTAGIRYVNAGLAVLAGSPSLDSAKPCRDSLP